MPPRRKKTAFARPYIIVSASALFALALAEAALRLLDMGYGNAPMEPHPILHHVHPRDYTYLAHSASGEYGGFHVYYGDDRRSMSASEWLRGPTGPERPCRVAFLGDSYTEAIQVAFESSFVGRIAQHSACEVRNYGMSSYSPLFFLTQWRYEVARFRPTLVVVQLYSNDVGGDAFFAPHARFDQDGLPTAIPGRPDDVVTPILRRSYVARLVRKLQLKAQWLLGRDDGPTQIEGEENPDISPLSSKLTTALATDVAKSGGAIALFVVPSHYRLANPEARLPTPEFSDKWKAWSRETGIGEFVDVLPAFRLCAAPERLPFFPRDIHFNALGHEITAAVLCQRLGDKLGLPPDCAGLQMSCNRS
jgi:hypothetical protein